MSALKNWHGVGRVTMAQLVVIARGPKKHGEILRLSGTRKNKMPGLIRAGLAKSCYDAEHRWLGYVATDLGRELLGLAAAGEGEAGPAEGEASDPAQRVPTNGDDSVGAQLSYGNSDPAQRVPTNAGGEA